MICSSAFWKQKCENLKNVSLTFFNFFFFVSADRQTFLGFEMTANLGDTSPSIENKNHHAASSNTFIFSSFRRNTPATVHNRDSQ